MLLLNNLGWFYSNQFIALARLGLGYARLLYHLGNNLHLPYKQYPLSSLDSLTCSGSLKHLRLFKKFSHIFHLPLPTTKSTIARQVLQLQQQQQEQQHRCLVKKTWRFFWAQKTGANYFDKWPKNCLALFETSLYCMHSGKRRSSSSSSRNNNNNTNCLSSRRSSFEWQRLLRECVPGSSPTLEWPERLSVAAIE